MRYDSYIFDRVQRYSEVSEEQLCDRESATAVEEETCSDPIPSVSSSGVSGTSGMNYQLMVTVTILTLKNHELTCGPYAVGDDSYIFYRVRSCSEVSEEQ